MTYRHGAKSSSKNNPNDPTCPSPPSDDVQCLSWSPVANYLVAGSWDCSVTAWEADPQGRSQARMNTRMGGPVFDTSWSEDGMRVFCCGADKTVKMWDLQTGAMQDVGIHDAPVKTCHWLPEMSMLMSTSWDKTVRFWDCRSPNPACMLPLAERAYAADVQGEMAVVATADRWVHVFNLNGFQEFEKMQSSLKMQTRCVGAFPSKDGYCLGTIEGRVAIRYVGTDPKSDKNFSYRCHRVNNDVYVVNSISFNPKYGSFATTGSDGVFAFWDKDQRQKIREFNPDKVPIPCSAFNADGSLFAYAQSYDWSMGHSRKPNYKNKIAVRIHPTPQNEVVFAKKSGR